MHCLNLDPTDYGQLQDISVVLKYGLMLDTVFLIISIFHLFFKKNRKQDSIEIVL